MTGSLDNLMKDYISRTKSEDMKILNQSRLAHTDGKFDPNKKNLMLRKGVVPWNIVDSIETLENTRKLPDDLSCYFSKLTESGISQQDLNHAKSFFDAYKCNNLLDYLAYYCELGMFLLLSYYLMMVPN